MDGLVDLEIVVLGEESDGFVDCRVVQDGVWDVVESPRGPAARCDWVGMSAWEMEGPFNTHGCLPCTAPLSSMPPAPFSCDLAAAFASAALLPMNLRLGFLSAAALSLSMLAGASGISGPKSAAALSSSISCVLQTAVPWPHSCTRSCRRVCPRRNFHELSSPPPTADVCRRVA